MLAQRSVVCTLARAYDRRIAERESASRTDVRTRSRDAIPALSRRAVLERNLLGRTNADIRHDLGVIVQSVD
jgi:hypothetical protein